jgi:hypothetical protein
MEFYNRVHDTQDAAKWNHLPIEEFNSKSFHIYIIDFEWNCLFANNAAKECFGSKSIQGKNLKNLPNFIGAIDLVAVYNRFKGPVEMRRPLVVRSFAACPGKRVEIFGRPFSDCYFLSIKEVDGNESFVDELTALINKAQHMKWI